MEDNWQTWNLEAGIDGYCPPGYDCGLSRGDFAVASLLWDLVDPKSANDADTIDLTVDEIWRIVGNNSVHDLKNMREVYLAFVDAVSTGLNNEDGSPVTIAELDVIFINHGFFADDGIPHWYNGEEVGWAGQPSRSNTPPIHGPAYLKINLEKENGQIADEGLLYFDVVFENPYYNYSYTVTLPGLNENYIYFEPPPTRTIATTTISARDSTGALPKILDTVVL